MEFCHLTAIIKLTSNTKIRVKSNLENFAFKTCKYYSGRTVGYSKLSY